MQNIISFLSLAAVATSLAIPGDIAKRASISVTPHDVYSSSIGVLGCKIDINRVAYFPGSPQCGSYCKKVIANGRSVNVLHIDSSASAYDLSYDAWNYLNVGKSATVEPTEGGGIPATVEDMPMSACDDLIHTPDKKLALTAANAVNTYINCDQHTSLWNIDTMTCSLGYNEECSLNTLVSNQPSCPHTLGEQAALDMNVWNIEYGTGKEVRSPK